MFQQLQVTCPYCHGQIGVPQNVVGSIVGCGLCGGQFQVPYPVAPVAMPFNASGNPHVHAPAPAISTTHHYGSRKSSFSIVPIVAVFAAILLAVGGLYLAIKSKSEFNDSDYGVLYNQGKRSGEATARGHHPYDGEGSWVTFHFSIRNKPAFERAKQADEKLGFSESRRAFLDGYEDGFRDGVR